MQVRTTLLAVAVALVAVAALAQPMPPPPGVPDAAAARVAAEAAREQRDAAAHANPDGAAAAEEARRLETEAAVRARAQQEQQQLEAAEQQKRAAEAAAKAAEAALVAQQQQQAEQQRAQREAAEAEAQRQRAAAEERQRHEAAEQQKRAAEAAAATKAAEAAAAAAKAAEAARLAQQQQQQQQQAELQALQQQQAAEAEAQRQRAAAEERQRQEAAAQAEQQKLAAEAAAAAEAARLAQQQQQQLLLEEQQRKQRQEAEALAERQRAADIERQRQEVAAQQRNVAEAAAAAKVTEAAAAARIAELETQLQQQKAQDELRSALLHQQQQEKAIRDQYAQQQQPAAPLGDDAKRRALADLLGGLAGAADGTYDVFGNGAVHVKEIRLGKGLGSEPPLPHQQEQQQQQPGGGGAPMLSTLTMELLYVTGCPGFDRQSGATSDCPTAFEPPTNGAPATGPPRLTIRGRGFRPNDPVAIVLISSKDTRAEAPSACTNARRSRLLPTLILTCDLPLMDKGGTFHVRVATPHGAVIKRNAVVYHASKGEGAAPGSGGAAGALDAIDSGDHRALGIGGLGPQFRDLFRRAFASRLGATARVTNELGIRHVKGVILHGPPGTGKTLAARKIAELLGARNVQTVSGPEIMSKFVGESEKNLRALFGPAENDAKRNGANAALHVVILDEIDAIMKPRGAGDDSSARAVYDSVTTQMLAYMDGMKQINNLLLIGLTNRLDALDKALLRPGRFEVQIRIPLPDGDGRLQILEIHTAALRERRYLAPDVDLPALAEATASFSGADIEGMVRSAVSFGFQRLHAQERRLAKAQRLNDPMQAAPAAVPFTVGQRDLARGLREVLASKGGVLNTAPHTAHGVVAFGDHISETVDTFGALSRRMRTTPFLRSIKAVLLGEPGSGKSALAALIAQRTRFAYVAMVTPDSLVGLGTSEKINKIHGIFETARGVAHACIVLDDIDKIIEYHAQNTRFNPTLQSEIAALIARPSAPLDAAPRDSDPRLMLLLTSSSHDAVRLVAPHGLDLTEEIPLMTKGEVAVALSSYHVLTKEGIRAVLPRLPPTIGIKRLLFIIDLARSYAAHPEKVARVAPTLNLAEDAVDAAAVAGGSGDDDGDGVGEADPAPAQPQQPVRVAGVSGLFYPTVAAAERDGRSPLLQAEDFLHALDDFGMGVDDSASGDTFDAIVSSF